MTFISFAEPFKKLIATVVASDELHAKWLNTLSYLENCGAKKIAACEHPTKVKEEMLKHAAEEFRHALYLKKQIGKIFNYPMDSYGLNFMLGGMATWHYLIKVDVQICRYLKKEGFTGRDLKEAAYLLTTYAIERRADELYPIYDEVLKRVVSKVKVKSILLEEEEHLHEMEEGIASLKQGKIHADQACVIESRLCHRWLEGLYK